ncbi:GNAT family N-acetyltransferase [Streptococcus suis]|uniref:N-acetyltransferase GCN5 n=1 Tax=Streptococcus suis TaxID=1307 RepID=A0A0Z8CRQ8_STRSU|nr:GNAT family N-acetyltransferase [Streptococcus suis]NQH95129.1 GNAT family N-acetyltransferase [Streptococcus suis]CYU30274.1 N-acetyltransferase GCN5 [Streptococcus suis]
MELRRPTIADKETILDMLAEFEAAGSAMDGGFISKDVNFEEWLEKLKLAELGLELPKGFVPYVQYVSFDQTGRALGFLSLRLRLNDFLLNKGGHIGYSIRPTERGKGYAKDQLRLGLQEAASKNITKVLVTCSTDNEASRKTIVACGGSLEDVREGVERYWID